MTILKSPPGDLDPALCCQVHAACRGDADGLKAALDQRARRLDTLGRALGHVVQPATPVSPGRARVRLRTLPDGSLGQALPGSHDLAPIAWCGLAHDALLPVLAQLPPMPKGLGSAEFRTDGRRVVLAARSRKPRLAKSLATALRRLDLPVDGIAVDGRTAAGDPSLTLTAGGISHRVSAETFTQTHLQTNNELVELVRHEGADATAVLDLYAGCGNLSLPLAAAGAALTMIESSSSSCSDARRTVSGLGLTADIRRGDAGRFTAGDAFYDLAILDPPRAGAPGVVAEVITTRPAMLIFVSCNPGYLGRDLKPAIDAGYQIARLQALDMFPLTKHVEVVAVLRR